MNTIIEAGGKQYRVAVGDTIEIEKLESAVGSKVKFPVLLIENGPTVNVGHPLLEGAEVSGEVVLHKKGPKLISYTYRRRKGSERKIGHRQPLTVVRITDIKE